jgi:hypothetical protein
MRNDFVRYVQKNPYASAAASDKKETILTDGSARTLLSVFPNSRFGCLELNGVASLKFFKPFQQFLECWSASRITDSNKQSCKLEYYDR